MILFLSFLSNHLIHKNIRNLCLCNYTFQCAYSGFRYFRIMWTCANMIFTTNYRLEFFKILLFLINVYILVLYTFSILVQFLKTKYFSNSIYVYVASFAECKVVKLTLFYSSFSSKWTCKIIAKNRMNCLYFRWQSQYKLSSLLKHKNTHIWMKATSYIYIHLFL